MHVQIKPLNPSLEGHRDPLLEKLAKCARSSESNICRNLHRLLAKPGYTLQVDISHAIINIRHARSRKLKEIAWPTLKLSSWLKYIMEQGGQLLLAGHHISQSRKWKSDLKEFWDLYEQVDGNHPVFLQNLDRAATLPFFLHGDEGRGRGKQPVMVMSFQGLFSHFGKERLNESGLLVINSTGWVSCLLVSGLSSLSSWSQEKPRHSFCSRLLYTVIPSRCYHGDATIFRLLDYLSEDCISLFQNGLDVPP